jgi:hypothetical protein
MLGMRIVCCKYIKSKGLSFKKALCFLSWNQDVNIQDHLNVLCLDSLNQLLALEFLSVNPSFVFVKVDLTHTDT